MAKLLLWLAIVWLAACAPSAADESPRQDIRFNQLGFQPNAAKRAIVQHGSTTPLPWRLLDSSGVVRAQGTTRVFGVNAASGERVHQIDFGEFQAGGEGYRLRVGGIESRPFAISSAIYASLKYDALAYFYHNRSGVPIEAAHVRDPQWARPAGHAPDRATCFNRTDTWGNDWPGCAYELDVTGGWYDAGDHGKYVVNGGISVWTLLNYYERTRHIDSARDTSFDDGRVSIPEAKNGVNDLLDEARFELEFLLAMQAPEGARAFAPVDPRPGRSRLALREFDASGMAHHKIGDEHWTPLPTAPHQDRERRFLYYPSTAATLNLAATAAQCARIWREIDPAFSARCLTAARRAYDAAKRNPRLYFVDAFTGSGGYGDFDATDEFYWASAELFATTGEALYERDLRQSQHFLAAPQGASRAGDISWGSVRTLGTISLALTPNNLPTEDRARARANLIAAASAYLQQSRSEGYALPYSGDTNWGSNSDIANRGLILALAYDLTREKRYRDGAVDAMDYILGRNPLDQSYVSGFGARAMRNPHHRFWARQADPSFPPPPSGALSGGPNSTALADPIAQTMRGACLPQTCWRDDYRAYALNEVAINWNAPLFWLAAFLDETGDDAQP